jgi:hypothetical protein
MVRARHDVRDDLRLGRIGHRRFEDADHGCSAWTEPDRLADHCGITAGHRRPETVRQDRHARGLGTLIGGVQQAAVQRPKPHDLEKRSVDDTRLHDARLLAEPDQCELGRGKVAECADRPDARREIADLGHREGEVLGVDAEGGLADVDEPIRVPVDERTQQHAPDDAEDRGVGADAQGECHDHGAGQALGTDEGAQGKPDVSCEGFGLVEPAWPPDAANGVARQEDVAELLQGGQARGFGILAAFDPLLDAQRQMAPDLLVELVQVWLHGRYSLPCAGFRTRPMAWTSCDHLSRSRASWAFPVAVSR